MSKQKYCSCLAEVESKRASVCYLEIPTQFSCALTSNCQTGNMPPKKEQLCCGSVGGREKLTVQNNLLPAHQLLLPVLHGNVNCDFSPFNLSSFNAWIVLKLRISLL